MGIDTPADVNKYWTEAATLLSLASCDVHFHVRWNE